MITTSAAYTMATGIVAVVNIGLWLAKLASDVLFACFPNGIISLHTKNMSRRPESSVSDDICEVSSLILI